LATATVAAARLAPAAQLCLRPVLHLRRDTGFTDTVGMFFAAIAVRLAQGGQCEQKHRGCGKQQSAHDEIQ